MKLATFGLVLLLPFNAYAQQTDQAEIEQTLLTYIEGFYEGDEYKLLDSVMPTLEKYGYSRDDETGEAQSSYMSYSDTLAIASEINETRNFAKPGDPKDVVVFDIGDTIASAKIRTYWGMEYVVLTRSKGKWMVKHVMWEERE